ncbi:hypothetical protein TRVL_03807 [Trypanosoma vivax]|nr:hypothetical protein TRVL_03807 [Trypanosoma vivax]
MTHSSYAPGICSSVTLQSLRCKISCVFIERLAASYFVLRDEQGCFFIFFSVPITRPVKYAGEQGQDANNALTDNPSIHSTSRMPPCRSPTSQRLLVTSLLITVQTSRCLCGAANNCGGREGFPLFLSSHGGHARRLKVAVLSDRCRA